MNCGEWKIELIECARRDRKPGRELSAHLASCTVCRDRFEAERQLTGQLRIVRMQTAALRPPQTQAALLMQDFARAHHTRTGNLRQMPGRSGARTWFWSLAAAAALVFAIVGGHQAGTHDRHIAPAVLRVNSIGANSASPAGAMLYETSLGLSRDASALSSDDFVAVPYTLPLAPGEIVRVVQTQLSPDALASMGVNVDPSWGSDVQADVVVGEDGLPRAVRIAGNGQESSY